MCRRNLRTPLSPLRGGHASRMNLRQRTSGVLCSLLLTALWACNAAEPVPLGDFATPSGLAVGGSGFDRVFIANPGVDALQVMALRPQLKDVDMVAAPARYFPLHLPAGPHPTHVAASYQGAFIFVLDAATGELRVVDADSLQLLTAADGAALALPLGVTLAGRPGGEPHCVRPCCRRACLSCHRLCQFTAGCGGGAGGAGPRG